MKNLDPLSRSKPRELDRKMWADIDRLMYEFQVKGRGEYLSEEPIYFGTAFASPPTLAYSSTSDPSGGEVIPGRFVPPENFEKDVDIYHLSTHSGGVNLPPILDPGFEVQGQWVPMMGDVARRIPTTSEGMGDYEDWPIYKYWDDGGYEPQNDHYREPNYGGGQNCWVQTSEVRGRWSVSDDRSHDYGVGSRGEYSAKFTFVDSGSSTWLIPVGQNYYNVCEPYDDEGYVDHPANAHWVYISMGTHGLGYYEGDKYRGTDTPPMLNGWDGTAVVWSDDDCELEVWTYNWWYNKDRERWDYSSVPTERGGEWWDYPYMPLSYDDPRPLTWGDLWDSTLPLVGSRDNPMARMGNDVKVKIPIVGGKWNDVSFHLSRERNQWEPNHMTPPLDSPMLEFETFRFRINKGKSGQVVHFDNAYIWPDLKNVYVPMVTVGVAEWVTDEQGAYIGARLWIKVGS